MSVLSFSLFLSPLSLSSSFLSFFLVFLNRHVPVGLNQALPTLPTPRLHVCLSSLPSIGSI